MSPDLENIRILDCHGHLGQCRSFHMAENGSVESMIEVMNASRIERIAVSSMKSLYYDVRAGNSEMIEVVQRHPDRFYGYVSMHPDMDEKAQIDELETYRDQPGIVGVKIHPGLHKSHPDCPGYEPVYQWCAERGYPLLSHTWGKRDVEDFHKILDRVPRLQVILGHSGGPFRDALEHACVLASKRERVFLDITCSQTLAGLIEWMTEHAPIEQILFGSDTPFIDPRPSVGLVRYSRVSDATKHAIFHENATRLFEERS